MVDEGKPPTDDPAAEGLDAEELERLRSRGRVGGGNSDRSG